MSGEPENLVLVLLRKLETKIDALDAKVDRKFDDLECKVDSVIKQMIDISHDVSMLTQEIAPGEMGAIENDIADLKRRVALLERKRQ